MAALSRQQRVDGLAVHEGSEEDALAVPQVLGKDSEDLLGLARIVQRKLAGDHIPVVDALKLGEVGRRRRRGVVATKHELQVLGVLLLEGLGHVGLRKQHFGQVLGRAPQLIQVAHARSLAGHDEVRQRNVEAEHLGGLGLAPLVQVAAPAHRQLQQRVSGHNVARVLHLLDAVVKLSHHAAHLCRRLVSVIQIVLKGVVGRGGPERSQHIFRNWNVDRGPDAVGDVNVVAKLGLAHHSVLVGLVVPSAHDGPRLRLDVVRALDDGIVLDLGPRDVNGHVLGVYRYADLVGLLVAGRRGLEDRGHPCAAVLERPQIEGQAGLHVLARHCFARVDDVLARRPRDVELSLPHHRLANHVVGRRRHNLEQKVDRVLVRRLPLVHPPPRAALGVLRRRHWRHAGRKDAAVRLVLVLGVEDLANALLHRRAVACQKGLGLDAHDWPGRGCKVRAQIGHKLPGTAQSGGHGVLANVVVGRKERQALDVATLVLVNVKDAEEVQVGNVLAVDKVLRVLPVPGREARVRDLPVRRHPHELAVPRHVEAAALPVGLDGHRVALENVIRPVPHGVGAFERDGVVEAVARRLELLGVPLHVRERQDVVRLLKRAQ